ACARRGGQAQRRRTARKGRRRRSGHRLASLDLLESTVSGLPSYQILRFLSHVLRARARPGVCPHLRSTHSGACARLPRPTVSGIAEHRGARSLRLNLKCYKVKESAAQKVTYTADLGGLAPEPGCQVKTPAKLLCVETTKSNVSPTPPGAPG